VSERVDVRVHIERGSVILPPEANYGGPEALRGMTLRLATTGASLVASDMAHAWRTGSGPPPQLAHRLFAAANAAAFPHRPADFSAASLFARSLGVECDDGSFGTPQRTQRFELSLPLQCTTRAAAGAPVRVLLQPTVIDTELVLQKYARAAPLLGAASARQQRVNPRVEVYVRAPLFNVTMTQRQYVYLLYVLDERLVWSGSQLSERQRAEQMMEALVRAAESGQSQISAHQLQQQIIQPPPPPPLKFVILLQVSVAVAVVVVFFFLLIFFLKHKTIDWRWNSNFN
jgi:hypothetical protein